jgi:hypothetical protein
VTDLGHSLTSIGLDLVTQISRRGTTRVFAIHSLTRLSYKLDEIVQCMITPTKLRMHQIRNRSHRHQNQTLVTALVRSFLSTQRLQRKKITRWPIAGKRMPTAFSFS